MQNKNIWWQRGRGAVLNQARGRGPFTLPLLSYAPVPHKIRPKRFRYFDVKKQIYIFLGWPEKLPSVDAIPGVL